MSVSIQYYTVFYWVGKCCLLPQPSPYIIPHGVCGLLHQAHYVVCLTSFPNFKLLVLSEFFYLPCPIIFKLYSVLQILCFLSEWTVFPVRLLQFTMQSTLYNLLIEESVAGWPGAALPSLAHGVAHRHLPHRLHRHPLLPTGPWSLCICYARRRLLWWL